MQESVEERVGTLAETFKNEFGDGMAKVTSSLQFYSREHILRAMKARSKLGTRLSALVYLGTACTGFPLLNLSLTSFSWRSRLVRLPTQMVSDLEISMGQLEEKVRETRPHRQRWPIKQHA